MWARDVGALLLALGALDALHVRALRWSPADDRTLRFFLLHVGANLAITLLTAGDVVETLRDPLGSVRRSFDLWPLKIALALHLYHFKDYAGLSRIDWVHHLSVVALAGLTVYAAESTGPLCNFCLFFICGLPGGLDYALLVGRKWGWITSLAEKRANAYLHQWIRAPGLVAYGTIAVVTNQLLPTPLPSCALAFFVVPVIFNALYFAHRVVENYGYSRALRPSSACAGAGRPH